MRRFVNTTVTQYTNSVNGVSLPTDYPQGRLTVHGWTVRCPLTGCQVTWRPRYRLSIYSKWLDTFRTALLYMYMCIFIHSLVFSPRGRSGRNQSPVMEPLWLLAHCILGKFLGIVCHCFSPPLDIPTFATTCLCVLSDARDPSSERQNCGRERCPVVILPKFRLPRKFRDLLHAANLRHGTDGFTSPPKEGVLRNFSP